MTTPRTLEDLNAVIGQAETRVLARVFGGRVLDVPADPHGRGRAMFGVITQTIGAAAAEALCRRYAGEHLYIPRGDASARRQRNQQIVQEYRSGMSVAALVARHRISERWVRAILAAAPVTNSPQAELSLPTEPKSRRP